MFPWARVLQISCISVPHIYNQTATTVNKLENLQDYIFRVPERCHTHLSLNEQRSLLTFLTVLQKPGHRSKASHSKHLAHSLVTEWSSIQAFNHILEF